MPRLSLYKSHLEAARDRASLTQEEMDKVHSLIEALPSGMPRVELSEYPISLLRSLLEDSKLKPAQRATLALYIYGLPQGDLGHEELYQLRVRTPIEFGSALAIYARRLPNAELHWNGRWYPVTLRASFQEDENKLGRIVHLNVSLVMGHCAQQLSWLIEPGLFQDARGNSLDLTVLQVMENFGLRRLQTPPQQYNNRLMKAEHLAGSAGTQVWVRGAVMDTTYRFWFSNSLNERPLGTQEVPRRAVVEPDLDSTDRLGRAYGMRSADTGSPMPLVRIFSLDTKGYVYADVDDLEPYDYDGTAINRLFLPPKMKDVLTTLFQTPVDQLFGDLIRGKHGGIVILASGNTGVGKTLTAEIYAEIAQRPLYVLEFGELGTTVKDIEQNLQSIFARVVRWRAVLQFDECEIFLSQRGDDLNRSAIVGIFLRMLDYYEGLLFLTTNRPAALDHAIRSRVMLRLEYPDLDQAARAAVWRVMFESAGMTLTEGSFHDLANSPMNGRQIRNLVRLARVLHPSRQINLPEMLNILEYACH